MVATTGFPVVAAAAAAIANSVSSYMVSTHSASAPPATRPRACSVNARSASSSVSGPEGANSSPVGPIEPATATG